MLDRVRARLGMTISSKHLTVGYKKPWKNLYIYAWNVYTFLWIWRRPVDDTFFTFVTRTKWKRAHRETHISRKAENTTAKEEKKVTSMTTTAKIITEKRLLSYDNNRIEHLNFDQRKMEKGKKLNNNNNTPPPHSIRSRRKILDLIHWLVGVCTKNAHTKNTHH